MSSPSSPSPGVVQFYVPYKEKGKSTSDQANQILNAVNALLDNGYKHIGLTYSANAGQTVGLLNLYGYYTTTSPNTKPIPLQIDVTTAKSTKVSGTNQAAVISALYTKINSDKTNSNKILTALRIIPFSTMAHNGAGHDDEFLSGQTVTMNDTNWNNSIGGSKACIDFANDFLKIEKSIILGWCNEDTVPLTNSSLDGQKNYFGIGGGVVKSDPQGVCVKYNDFLKSKWTKQLQDAVDTFGIIQPPSPTPSPTPKKPVPIEMTPVGSSSSYLKSRIDAVTAATKKSHPLFTVANEIYNTFFATTPKTGTKESLTEQLRQIETEITKLPDANKATLKSRIDKVKKDLQTAATSAAAATPTPPVKPVTKKDVVFAFDIDNTLVQHGKLESESSSSFNATTHAADYNAMVARMKEIINAGYYVWIVTANNKIIKDNFEKTYLKSDTDTSISNSDKYYFMNPTLVTKDLSGQFISTNFTSFNKPPPPHSIHDLSFNTDSEFQSKGLKPYAMRAKWMQLEKSINDTNVEMYLFDDNKTSYENKCNLLNVKFVKINTTTSGSSFGSDVLQKATDVFETIKKSSGPGPTSGGGNLNVMTFNTWYEALGANPTKGFCKDGDNNKCQNNIRQAILDHMKHKQSIVFLQEFTYKFDEFFNVSGGGVTVNKDEFASKIMANGSSSIPAFRYFTMKYDSKTFHVYIGQIGQSVIATIYSDTFHSGPADEFFVGNLAAGNLKAGSADSEAKSYDLAYTFSGTSDKTSGVTETKPPTSGHAFGGNRPFIILRFDTKKCVLVNVHVPHGGTDDVFKDKGKPTNKPTGSLADFAFGALARFIPDTVFNDKSKPQNEYAFILGGDFNTDKPNIEWLTESTTSAFTRTTGTCCTTSGGTDFTTQGAFDHIFSTLPITKYEVHKIVDTEKTSSPPPERYYFSDHLPVYAEIDFKAPTPHATSSS